MSAPARVAGGVVAPPELLWLGIDLGTTFTKVSVLHEGKLKAQQMGQGAYSIPSVVRFTEENLEGNGEPRIKPPGAPALGSHDLFDAKRFLGRTLRDAETQRIRHMNLPFAVVPDEQQRAVFRVVCNKSSHAAEGRYFNVMPEDVSAQVLKCALKPVIKNLKMNLEFVEKGGKQPVVITIPAAFPDSQRQATRDAAVKAGLDVKLLLPEPTAAALAYFHANPSAEVDGNYLVFDFGGGTLDISILQLRRQGEQRHYTVLACEGDTFLGGRDIDELLFEHFAGVFFERLSSTVDTNSKAAKKMSIERRKDVAMKEAALRNEVRMLKCSLADDDDASFDASAVLSSKEAEQCDPEHLTMQFSVRELQALLRQKEAALPPKKEAGVERVRLPPQSLEDRMHFVVRAAMSSAKLQATDLKAVMFAGGSSRIRGLDAIIHEALGAKVHVLDSADSVDQLVAGGAALVADQLRRNALQLHVHDGPAPPPVSSFVLHDAIPNSLGICVLANDKTDMSVLLPKSTNYPVTVEKSDYTTTYDNQQSVRIAIYEGEHAFSNDNTLLDSFSLDGLPRKPKYQVSIQVSFTLDSSGILTVSAACRESGSQQSKTLEVKSASALAAAARAASSNVNLGGYSRDVAQALDALTRRVYSLQYRIRCLPPTHPDGKPLMQRACRLQEYVQDYHGAALALEDVRAKEPECAAIEAAVSQPAIGGGGMQLGAAFRVGGFGTGNAVPVSPALRNAVIQNHAGAVGGASKDGVAVGAITAAGPASLLPVGARSQRSPSKVWELANKLEGQKID